MENKDGENKAPEVIEHDTCQSCGGTEFLIEKSFKEEQAKGLIPKTSVSLGILPPPAGAFVVFDPSGGLVGVTAPVFVLNLDVCTKCGAVIARRITQGRAVVQVQPAQGAQPFRFNPKGGNEGGSAGFMQRGGRF